MSTPLWTLLIFAGWTLLSMVLTIGVIRWQRVLTGKASPTAFKADVPHGSELYRRAMRAHTNCVENLPIYTALVFILYVVGLDTHMLDVLAITFLACRMMQTITHISFTETKLTVSLRFTFYFAQVVCMFWMGVLIIRAVW